MILEEKHFSKYMNIYEVKGHETRPRNKSVAGAL